MFIIKLIVRKKVYYFFDYERTNDIAYWTEKFSRADTFHSENAAEEFVKKYLKNRKCEITEVYIE